jgi:aerobic-type carbon monoxide dehydrogenase small subunit (CoxS/CutS family)
MSAFTLKVNGAEHQVDVDPQMPLLWVLRDVLNLTGTKFGCGIGMCGACTVIVDGAAIRSCITPASSSAGKTILTIEGLSADASHPVQQAWLAEEVSQCGYCQPGKIMSAVALLDQNPRPSQADLESAFENHLCRCGTYLRIRSAMQRAVEG